MKPNRQILDEASTWFVDFRAGDIDARARQEFNEWLRRSPEHIQAYLDIAATYTELPAPTTNGAIDVQGLIDKARVSAEPNIVHLPSLPGPRVAGRSVRTLGLRPMNVFAAAAAMLVVFVGAYFYTQRGTYSTGIGEQRSLALADGSTIQLNSRSRIRVRYTDDERRIELIDGQALFQVAKNTHRPFIVHVDDTQVRAVGTQFDVYRKHSGTVVTVLEGRVAVDSDAPHSGLGPPASDLMLAAGEQAIIGNQMPKLAQQADTTAATAWTQRQLIFENASLSEVAEEFNRYSTRPMIVSCHDVDDPLKPGASGRSSCLSAFHVSGTYSSTNHESLLRFLRLQPGIRLIESDTEIRITQ